MTYSLKRRRINSDTDETSTLTEAPVRPPAHHLQEIVALPEQDQRTPPRIEEVHVRVRRYQASKRSHDAQEAHHRALHRRRTGHDASTTTTSSWPPPALVTAPPARTSLDVVVGVDGLLTPITWVFAGTAPGVALGSAETVVAATASADTPMVLVTTHVTALPPSHPSSTPTSSGPTTTTSSTTTTTTTPAQGIIGLTPIAPSPVPTTTSTTTTSTPQITPSPPSNVTTPSISTSSTKPSDLTTHPANNGTATSHSSSTTSSTDLLGSYGMIVTTLPDGRIMTIPATRPAQVTTLPDGQVVTNLGDLIPITPSLSTPSASDPPSPYPTNPNSIPLATGGGLGGGGQSGQGGSAGSAASPGPGSPPPPPSGSGDGNMPPPQVLAGGIVGGVAGIAIILFVAMLFFRWYRRRGSMQRLDNGPSDSGGGRPGMAERAGLLPLVAAATSLLRGRKNDPAPERGFQRVSGRKLPSAFSEGLTGPPTSGPVSPRAVPMPAAFENGTNNHTRNAEGSGDRSFYRDSRGYYGGTGIEGSSSEPSPAELEAVPAEIQPGPARQAQLHPGGPYNTSKNPFETPPGSPRGPLVEGRAATPVNLPPEQVGGVRAPTPQSHNSRFTEEV